MPWRSATAASNSELMFVWCFMALPIRDRLLWLIMSASDRLILKRFIYHLAGNDLSDHILPGYAISSGVIRLFMAG